VVSGLEQIASAAGLPAHDFRNAWATERGLQLGAEIILDVGNHILSAHFGISPQDYEDILTQLGRQGILDHELQERLKGLGGFRNILVHGYLRLDPARVAEHASRAPRDFSAFASAVRAWLGGVPEAR
jgi:uncharacterized protein YutE (UPF0331/DUF86 family)